VTGDRRPAWHESLFSMPGAIIVTWVVIGAITVVGFIAAAVTR
jgi:hypothetical protein